MSDGSRPLDLDRHLPEIGLIADAELAAKVRAVWEELWSCSEFASLDALPTSDSIPYPFLPHTRSVIALALGMAETLERFHGTQLDRDVLLAACLLQDASKCVEYRPLPGGGVAKTPLGEAMPHAFEAARVAASHGVPLEVLHIIATHSPSAARLPRSLEGTIVYLADEIDVAAIDRHQFVKEQILRRR